MIECATSRENGGGAVKKEFDELLIVATALVVTIAGMVDSLRKIENQSFTSKKLKPL